ncbi:hypothetical protein [Paenibacillus peoriae]|uniref:hypothetical protein n=1 Tax=Paenibacillus peoriae TaxID=59893 RepID=UPI00215B17C4|nr:hypothetical protein [Paenibacillus peoriae]
MSLDEQINDFKGKLEKYQRCKTQLQNEKLTYFSVYKIGNKTFQGFTLGEIWTDGKSPTLPNSKP